VVPVLGLSFISAVKCYRRFGENLCLHLRGPSDLPIHFDPKYVSSRFLRHNKNSQPPLCAHPEIGLKVTAIHRQDQTVP